jgi:hypothetical protein
MEHYGLGRLRDEEVHRMRSRLSFANVTSSIALFVALGGGAYAATGGSFVSSSGTIRGCIKHGGALIVVKAGRHCPRGTVSLPFAQRGPTGPSGARGATGKTGANGANGKNGANGTNGTNGKNGEPGTALGYARVYFNGTETLVFNAKNVTAANVTRTKAGVVCFHGLPFTISNIQATLGFTGGDVIKAQAPGTETDCKEAGNDAEILTEQEGKPTDVGFMVLFN